MHLNEDEIKLLRKVCHELVNTTIGCYDEGLLPDAEANKLMGLAVGGLDILYHLTSTPKE